MSSARTRLARLARTALIDPVPRDHSQPDAAFRRRRIVAAVTLVVGTAVLGISLAVKPGDPAFYPLTLALAAVWLIGGFASGPLHLGRIAVGGRLRRPVITPIVIGLIASAIFVVGALVVREIGPLADYTQNVLDHARKGSAPLLVLITVGNGITEEVFFRGALYAAIGTRHPVPITTVVYAIATLASGNPMLVFAALTLGLVLALQRRASGGLLAPILTHITWSVCMLFLLPPIFGSR
ncbi:MAG TPA: type II CAAX endopeptidase family protein [Jatrophihabitans sp.]|nr:type II CAAX endopeptidase family protein [Jatrophihabitans sp.]